ncbi:MAG: 23S rRNA (adenine(2503)-C(2))-methyltransferase RlmN, partial [Burkholderiaceae bacterium]
MNLLGCSPQGLTDWCVARGEKPFRARQLLKWVHQRGTREFAAMTDLARDFRAGLEQDAAVELPPVLQDHVSADGTRKWLFDMG